MISNINTVFLKAEKELLNKNKKEANKLLQSVIEHDNNHYGAYKMLYSILAESQSSKAESIYKELRRLNPSFEIKHKKIYKTKKKDIKKTDLPTISLINLMINQGKKRQAKKSLKDIIQFSKNSKDVSKAKKVLEKL